MSGLARALRKRSTRAERTVWRWLRNRGLLGFKFRRQHPVFGYVLDFYCPELQLCIEIDGTVHGVFAQSMHDADRSCALSKLRIDVVRLRNEDVLDQPAVSWQWIVGAVAKAICERTGRSELEVMRELHEWTERATR